MRNQKVNKKKMYSLCILKVKTDYQSQERIWKR